MHVFSTPPRFWQPNDTILLTVGIVLSVVAKGLALFALSFSVDDLIHWNYGRFGYLALEEHTLREGRFLAPYLIGLIDVLGVNIPRSFTLFGFWLSVCFSLCGILLVRLWRIQHDLTISALVVGIIVLHPYQADFFTWKIAMNVGVPFLLGLAAVLVARDAPWGVPIGAGLFVMTLGLYQVPLPFTACAVVFALALDVLRWSASDFSWRRWGASAARMIGCVLLGTAIYFVIAKLIILSYGKPSVLGRDEIILLSHPGLVLMRARELLEMIIARDPLTSIAQRIILAALVSVTIIAIFLSSVQERAFKRAAIRSAVFLAAISLCFILATGLMVVVKAWFPAYRTLVGVSVIWAGVIASALLVTSGRVHKVVVVAAGLLLFGFAGKNNEILSDQLRVNERDRLMMSRISADLEHLPNFSAIRRVAFVGTNPAPLRGLTSGMDISRGWGPYGVTLSVFALFFGEDSYLRIFLNDSTGYQFGAPSKEEQVEARSACASIPPWPAAGSVRGESDRATVCLGPATSIEQHRLAPPRETRD
jgi:hypothetical protein